jgi:hypothetical protein
MGFGGFSWKRAIGLSAAKARLSRRVGIRSPEAVASGSSEDWCPAEGASSCWR